MSLHRMSSAGGLRRRMAPRGGFAAIVALSLAGSSLAVAGPPQAADEAVAGAAARPAAAIDLTADPLDLTFDAFKFEVPPEGGYDPAAVPESVRALEGRRIKIRGYIRPNFQQAGIRKFVLVRDNQECCFGPGAAIYDCVLVQMGEGQSLDFTVRPIGLVGVLYLKAYKGPDGKIWALFRMKDARLD